MPSGDQSKQPIKDDSDLQRFEKHGLATKTRMAAYDMLSCIDLKLRTEFDGLSLEAFTLEGMEQLPPDFQKVWNALSGQWMRAPHGAAAQIAGKVAPQLPPDILKLVCAQNLSSLRELNLSWDSAWP